ncbi:hypothetical protein [Arthrobacter psychrolactophilus]|uniref:hypothetical protein n=1 Tax=Arthrobacter psychrolactophilus TaxID=92442 RepID=UPI0011B3741C|nr:hypothetical protein [Arthrobacter psychrolactophilus]
MRDVNGGIQPTEDILKEANERVPWLLAGMGDWDKAVVTIEIDYAASDHAAVQSEADGCSTMPQDVANLSAATE